MHSSSVLLAIVAGVPALVMLATKLFPQARISLWLMRSSFGRRERQANMTRAAEYHARLPHAERVEGLEDRTWRDLDLDEIFLSLDRTESEPGRQYLYHLLRTPGNAREPLDALDRAVRHLSGDVTMAARVRDALRRLDDPRAGQIVHLLFGELPRRPRLWWTFPLLTAGSIACLLLMPVWSLAPLVWLGICSVNLCLQLYNRERVKQFVPALHEVPNFVRVARMLGALDLPPVADRLRSLRQGASTLNAARHASLWLMFEPNEGDPVLASIYEYINLLFLFDVNAFIFAVESVRASRTTMRQMFEAIGYVDAVQSIASWRASLPRWTTPELTEPRKTLEVDGLAHPLVDAAVGNSLQVDGTSVLITGSNMSGKSTFVRAMGVNAVLAQSLYTVYADRWRAPFFRVRTSIGRADSIMEGKSYYLAEVESVRALVRSKASGRQHLFLLDEIFRGTNTSERVAAAYAVLSYLNRGTDLVFVATHDIEVIDLLGGVYAPHHFREEVMARGLSFDYRLRPGSSSTRNAIALLELMQYPDELVADARAALAWERRPATNLTRRTTGGEEADGVHGHDLLPSVNSPIKSP